MCWRGLALESSVEVVLEHECGSVRILRWIPAEVGKVQLANYGQYFPGNFAQVGATARIVGHDCCGRLETWTHYIYRAKSVKPDTAPSVADLSDILLHSLAPWKEKEGKI